MKTLILPSYCVLLISLSACDSHDIARQHGLESLNTLLTLQQSQSIRDVSKYLSKFNDWRDYNEDTTSGGMWIYHKKNASTRYILTISKGDGQQVARIRRPSKRRKILSIILRFCSKTIRFERAF